MINRIAFLKVASLAGAAVLLPGEWDSEALATALGVYIACSVRGSAFRRIELLNIYNGTPLVLERYERRRGHDTKNVYFYQREDFS